ncbi:hypothetical protein [uncultured Veillonella sp.]|jgi:hypothetical protein|uniref:VgrG-related protein n=1 Tax=uncultured Veillonella sp. TaxID=159268 RepID=UPI00258F25AB|nr:hypothetical protein [uncultured Veillonella sp.]
MLGDLSAKYESNGNALCVSDGWGDPGGKSYGAYQLSSNAGSLQEFMQWCRNSGEAYKVQIADTLCEYSLCSSAFDAAWRSFDESQFLQVQHEYIKERYYDVAVRLLRNAMFNIENHSEVMKDVIWSRAVQYGTSNIVEMFEDALRLMPNYDPSWNLSYVDALRFDWDIINCVYDVCMTEEWNSSALRDNLNARFRSEKSEALARFISEIEV